MTDTLSTGHADLGRLRYAEACLKQGMSYQAAARASDVCETDLRNYAPDYGRALREAPASSRTPLARCAAMLPDATPVELAQIAALALRLLCEAEGIQAVQKVCTGIIKAMPARFGLPTPRQRFLDAVDEIADRHGISREDLLGPSHLYQFAHPRQEAYWTVRKETGFSYPAIGRLFGRDQSTIRHGVEAHEARLTEAMQ
jgi:hypothetical protein